MTLRNQTDQDLIAKLNAGDPSAFEPLYQRYRDWVVRLATRFTGHSDDALDVLQETFSYFFRKFPGFMLTASMTTFLYPVVKNLSIAAKKKRKRSVQEDPAFADLPARSAAPADAREEMTAVLSTLSDAHREVVLMRFVDDMTLDEIAQALSVPTGTVKSRLHNALQQLRADPRLREHFS